MKNNVLKTMMVVVAFGILMGCSKKDATPKFEITQSKLYDKCWYPINDAYGTKFPYTVIFRTSPNSYGWGCSNYDGTWKWLSADSIETTVSFTGQKSAFYFTEISDHTMRWGGVANGVTYSYSYTDSL